VTQSQMKFRVVRGWGLAIAGGLSIPVFGLADEAKVPPVSATSETTSASPAETDELDRKVEQVTVKMQQAQSKLAGKETGTATQDLQKAILAEIDELLQTPPQPNQPSSGGGGSSGSSSNNSSSGKGQKSSSQPRGSSPSNAQQQSGPQPGRQQPMPAGAQQGSEQERKTAEDSEERTGESQDGKTRPLPRRRMELDVWGHLPDKVREKLLSAYGERMVPQYEDLVQRFYRSLAETGSPETSRAAPGRPNR